MSDVKLNLNHAKVKKAKKGKRVASLADFPESWLAPELRKGVKKIAEGEQKE